MLWLAVLVIGGLGFLASEALFSSLEVIVLALVAFPSSIWEHKSFPGTFKFFFDCLSVIILRIKILAKIWVEGYCARNLTERRYGIGRLLGRHVLRIEYRLTLTHAHGEIV